MDQDHAFLASAIDLSEAIARDGGFPVGAIIVVDGEMVARGVSDGKRHHDPTWHAEVDAIRKACALLKTRNLKNATLYSSMEPCLMCYSACYWSHMGRIVFACKKEELNVMHYENGLDFAKLRQGISENWSTEIVHKSEFEARALGVVTSWEFGLQSVDIKERKF